MEASRGQKERCAERHEQMRIELLEPVDPVERRSIVEAGSLLGRKRLDAIPYNTSLRLSDFEISAALHLRMLHLAGNAFCPTCGVACTIGHDEVCKHRPITKVSRHEKIKSILAKAFGSAAGVTVQLEPAGSTGPGRNDIRVVGSAASGVGIREMDIKVSSLYTDDARQAIAAEVRRGEAGEDKWKAAAKEIQHWLGRVAREKTRKQPSKDTPFRPMVFSLGGMCEDECNLELVSWKKLIRGHSFMIGRLSLALLKGRTTSFVL